MHLSCFARPALSSKHYLKFRTLAIAPIGSQTSLSRTIKVHFKKLQTTDNIRNRLILLQAKRGDAGHATLECLDHTFGLNVVHLNGKIDSTVSWKPYLEETVSQGFDGSIE